MMRNLACPFIPLIRTKGEAEIVKSMIPEAIIARVPIDLLQTLNLPSELELWIDVAFDGFEFIFGNNDQIWRNAPSGWHHWVKNLENIDCMASERIARGAAQDAIDSLVASALDHAAEYKPSVISVPQVPYTTSADRHAINKKLAVAAGKWKSKNWKDGILVLPAVFTHPDAYRTRTIAKPKVSAIARALDASRATGVWVCNAGFDDLGGKGNLAQERFPALIALHEQLNESLPANTFTCAGPYWALNLILWARNLVDVPLVGCGSAFQHYLPRPVQLLGKQKGSARIALPPLRRWYPVNTELRSWIKSAKSKYPKGSQLWEEFGRLEASFSQYLGQGGRGPAMKQTAEFYLDWVKRIASTQPAGRALFLFQDFSTAVVNGSHIGTKLPKQGGLSANARAPGFVAQQFMLQCLPR